MGKTKKPQAESKPEPLPDFWDCLPENAQTLMRYELSEQRRAQIETSFTYHAPQADQPDRYVGLREAAKALAVMMCLNCPESRELSLALTHLQESVMWANASIAINE